MENSNQNKNATDPDWGRGLAQINEAIQHSVTASRLMWVGAFAIGAGVAAYLWDPKRRAEAMHSLGRWTGDMRNVWENSADGNKPDQGKP